MIGRTLLHYQILEDLGGGGMGTVYAAFDSRLGRRVALKVLPPEVVGDAERERRFEREARAVAALNHPNIVTLYSVEKAEGLHFITMEVVEGTTLAEVNRPTGVSLESFLALAIPLADALSAAHEHGITHRDLKPTNIMVSREGRVKVLDFGLAKIQGPVTDSPSSELPTRSMTEEGRILGTVKYMSPEQAEGKPVDHRTDVFSLGIVFYEMLTGRHPFPGDSSAATLSAILKDTPQSVTELNSDVPRDLGRVVKRCLSKDRSRRYQSCLDLRNELQEIQEELGASSGAALGASALPHGPRGNGLSFRTIASLAGALLVVTALLLVAIGRREPAKREVTRFRVGPPEGGTFGASPAEPQPTLSPDGRQLVYIASAGDFKNHLWVRALDSVSARPLPGTQSADLPFWSPDGKRIGFFAEGKLKKVDLSGGPPDILAEGGGGGSWSREGVILFGRPDGLSRVSSEGGEATRVTTLDATRRELAHHCPQFLPDGRRFLYLVNAEEPENRGVYAGSLDSSETKRVLNETSDAVYAPPGYLFFVRKNTLFVRAFDPSLLQPVGNPVIVADRVMPGPIMSYAPFSASADVLAYRQGGWSFTTQLAWLDRKGRELGTVGDPGVNEGPSLSADERRLAFSRFDQETSMDVWTIDLARSTTERLTADPGFEFHAIFSPDGEQVAFNSTRMGRWDLFRKTWNGPRDAQFSLPSPPSANAFPDDWSSDGRFLIVAASGDLWIVPVAGDEKPYRFLRTQFVESQPRLSPNGRWLAYTSDESGEPEVYVQEFRESGRRWRVSTRGGLDPRWRHDGRELFYLEPGEPTGASHVAEPTLTAVGVGSGSNFEAGPPQALFRVRVPDVWMRISKTYAVASRRERFLFDKVVAVEPSLITVVLNWKEALFP